MKVLRMLTLLLFMGVGAQAHDITNQCWNAATKKYSFYCTNLPNGSATIKIVDANNNVVTGSGAYSATVNVTGGKITVEVPQLVRTTLVRVRFTWHDGFVNLQYSGSNTCSVVSLNDYSITSRVYQGMMILGWEGSDYDHSALEYSKDGRNFTTVMVIMDNQIHSASYTLTSDKSYFRVRFTKNGADIFSNIVAIDYRSTGIDYSKPYTLEIYDTAGHLVKSLTNATQYQFDMKGYFYLKFIQVQKDTAIIEVRKVLNKQQ